MIEKARSRLTMETLFNIHLKLEFLLLKSKIEYNQSCSAISALTLFSVEKKKVAKK